MLSTFQIGHKIGRAEKITRLFVSHASSVWRVFFFTLPYYYHWSQPPCSKASVPSSAIERNAAPTITALHFARAALFDCTMGEQEKKKKKTHKNIKRMSPVRQRIRRSNSTNSPFLSPPVVGLIFRVLSPGQRCLFFAILFFFLGNRRKGNFTICTSTCLGVFATDLCFYTTRCCCIFFSARVTLSAPRDRWKWCLLSSVIKFYCRLAVCEGASLGCFGTGWYSPGSQRATAFVSRNYETTTTGRHNDADNKWFTLGRTITVQSVRRCSWLAGMPENGAVKPKRAKKKKREREIERKREREKEKER